MIIATGRYLQFAERLVADLADVGPLAGGTPVVHLFTDADTESLRSLDRAVDLRVFATPALRWPEASLLRYDLFSKAAAGLSGEVLMYLDADLRIHRDFTPLLTPDKWAGSLAAVRHPGYFRRRQIRPRGTWENRKESTAYVPFSKRRRYVCGGVWMGARDRVIAMCKELADRVQSDLSRGIVARWHDESHWNWWTACHSVELLDPSWCWVPTYPWLQHLEPIISAVEKGPEFERESTSDGVRAQLIVD